MTDKEETPKCTLFVGKLSKTTTDESLETAMSEFGPVKSCFVVRNRESGQSRGFGYVKFALKEDAKDALDAYKGKEFEGSKLHMVYADPKSDSNAGKEKAKGKKKKQTPEKEEEKPPMQEKKEEETQVDDGEDGNDDNDSDNEEEADTKQNKKSKKQKPVSLRKQAENDDGKTIVVQLHNKVPRKSLKNKIMKAGKVSAIKFLEPQNEDDDVLTVEIVYENHKISRQALIKLNDADVQGEKIYACLKTKMEHISKMPLKGVDKKARVIVRNVSFKATEKSLKNSFSKFGGVLQVEYPQRNNRPRGFAFIQYKTVSAAENAVNKGNGIEIEGRPVSVDWTMSKDRFEMEKAAEEESSDENSDNEDESGDDNHDHDGDEGDSDSDGNIEDDPEEFIDSSDSEDEREAARRARPNDTIEKKTIFIRNFPFSSTEQELKECLSEFGPLEYAKIVIDKGTGKPRGTAFAKFKDKRSAKKCLNAASTAVMVGKISEGGISINGRSLNVTLAVDGERASRLEEENKSSKKGPKNKDSRNLYLAKEGYIEENSVAAEGVSESDMAKRKKAQMEMSRKLKDPKFCISTTRLSARNIPINVDQIELRHIFNEAGKITGDPKPVNKITLFRDAQRKDQDGKSRSQGFAFVTMNSHTSALKALRLLNNNPQFFTQDKRLIIEFCIEDKKKMELHNSNVERQKSEAPKKKKKKTLGDRFKAKREARKLEIESGDTKETVTVQKSKNNKTTPKTNKNDHHAKKCKNEKDFERNSLKRSHNQKDNDYLNKIVNQGLNQMQKQKDNKKTKDFEEEHFSKLVNKYKSQLFGVKDDNKPADEPSAKKGRWFDED